MMKYSFDISEGSILPYTNSLPYELEIYLQQIREQNKKIHLNNKRQLT